MYMTAPEPQTTLVDFYATVRPGGNWKPVLWKVNEDQSIPPGPPTWKLFLYWITGIALVYGALFFVGWLLLR